ncbi:hypothetical protein, partial [Mycobacterium sp. 1245852.3]|uniref:hypothetical protein n=1 Tax=Mycobacterium sp. 1245852.3 TaxID=1856860 RepID=UPI001E2B31B0
MNVAATMTHDDDRSRHQIDTAPGAAVNLPTDHLNAWSQSVDGPPIWAVDQPSSEPDGARPDGVGWGEAWITAVAVLSMFLVVALTGA